MVVIQRGYVYVLRSAACQIVNEKVLPELINVYVLSPDPTRPERITFTNYDWPMANTYTKYLAAADLMFTEWQRRRIKPYTRIKIDVLIGGNFDARY